MLSGTLAYEDFLLSRQAMRCTKATLDFYKYTAGKFVEWLGERVPTAAVVREYLANLKGSDTTIHDHARAIRTLLRFMAAEKYIEPVTFEMPRVAKKRLPVLTADELKRVMDSCKSKRDKALVMFLADSGLRRAEVCKLNWGDVDMHTGLIRVSQGKGRKDRASVASPTTRRALLQYRRTLKSVSDTMPLFLSRTGQRLTGTGVLLIFRRLSEQTGIHITPHALRRTFVILSLEAGIDVLHLQHMLGHESLAMVYHYAQMADSNLLQSHLKYSPIENL